MSLNSEQMLPSRVRKMRQMDDLLTVEDLVLAEIEQIINEMYDAAALLHEELVNESWLEEKLEARTGADATVTADPDHLLADILLNVSEIYDVDMTDVRAFLNKWLPAHLQYDVTLLQESAYKSPEEFTMSEMALGFESQFWPVRTLNGTWLLDGSCLLDAIRKPDEYGLSYETGDTELEEDFPVSILLQTAISQIWDEDYGGMSMGFESRFWWRAATLNGLWNLDGTVILEALREPQEYGQSFGCGAVESTETVSYQVRLDKDLWYLNGSQNLNGRKILDAERREEELT